MLCTTVSPAPGARVLLRQQEGQLEAREDKAGLTRQGAGWTTMAAGGHLVAGPGIGVYHPGGVT